MKYFLIILLLICIGLSSKAQNTSRKRDSLFFQLDTAKVPITDRMWEIHQENSFVFYTFQCPCLANGANPTFIFNLNRPSETKIKNVSNIKLTSILELLRIVKQSKSTFNGRYLLYFIIPSNEGYVKRQVGLFSNRPPILDYEILKRDSSTKKD